MHGSNNEYLAPFERMFCRAPIITANMSGVVPSCAVMGAKKATEEVRDNSKKREIYIERERGSKGGGCEREKERGREIYI